MALTLLQPHTVQLYGLASKTYLIQKVKARTLLSVRRFDLFAKLFYASNRLNNPKVAREVYLQHIKAFNPDGKEPGRDDKNSFDIFINVFDSLLDYFKDNEFDDNVSIIPVSSEGIILDGAHRLAALAYYDKFVTIAKFENVEPVCQFDYVYFKMRGLPQAISDIIANEIILWKPNCLVACLWPRMGSEISKRPAINLLQEHTVPFYHKSFDVNLKSLTLFVAKVYRKQSWVGTEKTGYTGAKDKALNCYQRGNGLDLYFFVTEQTLEETLLLKEQVRQLFPYDKHTIHITDDLEETKDIAFYSLTQEGVEQWMFAGSIKGWQKIKQRVLEVLYIFRHTKVVEYKSRFAALLRR